LKKSARGICMQKAIYFLFVLSLVTFGLPNNAYSANRLVEIKQINPEGESKSETCPESGECEVYLNIITNEGKKRLVKTVVDLWPSGADFTFTIGEKPVILDQGYWLRVHLGKSSKVSRTVTLLNQSPEEKSDPYGEGSLVYRSPGEPFAQLKVSISAN